MIQTFLKMKSCPIALLETAFANQTHTFTLSQNMTLVLYQVCPETHLMYITLHSLRQASDTHCFPSHFSQNIPLYNDLNKQERNVISS